MKKYISKIICLVLIVAGVTISFAFNKNEMELQTTVRTIASEDKAASCTEGAGTTYYVTATALHMRTGPATSYTSLGTLPRCTQVKVYCTSGSWGRISKSSDKWMSISTKYASTSLPSGCGSAKQTTTNKVTFNLQTVEVYNQSGYDQLYADKTGGWVRVKLQNVKNLARDESGAIGVAVYGPNGDNQTWNFSVSKGTINDGLLWIDVHMNNGAYYTPGTYSVVSSAQNHSVTAKFTIVGNYYNYDLTGGKSWGDNRYSYANVYNQWKVTLSNIQPSWLNAYSFNYSLTDAYGNDARSKFNINVSQWDTAAWYIENKTSRNDAPNPGTYTFTVSYYDTNYSTSRGPIVKSYSFKIDGRNVTFAEDLNQRRSYRYNRSINYESYDIGILYYDNTNIRFYEGTTLKTMSVSAFSDEYTDAALSSISFRSDGHIGIHVANSDADSITVYKKVNNTVYYVDPTGVSTTGTVESVSSSYPTLTEELAKYKFESGTGYPLYEIKGNRKRVPTKVLSTINKTLLSGTGGKIYLTVNTDGLEAGDFYNGNYSLVITRTDGLVVTQKDGFYVTINYDTNTKKANITIDCDTEDDKYTGIYTLSIGFMNAPTFNFGFELQDGEIDYILQSEVDQHETDEIDKLLQNYPPGNKKYEYYVGFYLMKGGKYLTTKNNSAIGVRLFDQRVDYDANGNMYFYKQTDYQVRFKRLYTVDGVQYISYDLSVADKAGNYGTWEAQSDMTVAAFTAKYQEAAQYIKYYTFNQTTDGLANSINTTVDGYDVHIKKYYTSETDGLNYVTFNVGSGASQTMVEEDFKSNYADAYANLIVRFVFDGDSNIMTGAIRGSYKEKINEGKEVTDLFNISIDKDASNVQKTVKILPKTEVPKDTYFVYVSYDVYSGIGYLNNGDEPIFEKAEYPEMWNQNIHMTSITYDTAVYSINGEDPVYSNTGNNSEKMYPNVTSKAEFPISLNYIYNFEGVDYKVEHLNSKTGKWEDKTSWFTYKEEFATGDSKLTLTNRVGVTESGKYKLTINYLNSDNGQSCTYSKEFEISLKYYGLDIDDSVTIKYAHNYVSKKNINAVGYFIKDINDIKYKLVRRVNEMVSYEYECNDGKCVDENGKSLFTYTIQSAVRANDANTIDYTMTLSNIKNVSIIGAYTLYMSYQEEGEELSESSIDFNVGEDEYNFELGEESAIANEINYSIVRPIYSTYVSYEDLDNFVYTIYYWDHGQYVDVSSDMSSKKMFIVSDSWDSTMNTNPNADPYYDYKGTLNIQLIDGVVDMDGDYYIDVKYGAKTQSYNITNLRKIFAWEIDNLEIDGIYDNAGEDVNVNGFYSNLSSLRMKAKIETVHTDIPKYKITQECLDDICVPSNVIDYSNRFNLVSKTATEIVVDYRNDLTATTKLKLGTYAFVVYYSDTDYKVYPFEVNPEFITIAFEEEPLIYTDITTNYEDTDYTTNGLFSNKVGHIYVPVEIIGVPYSDDKINISITNTNGDMSYEEAFTYLRNEFNNDHVLNIKYNPNAKLSAGNYLVTVSYVNSAGKVIKDSLVFTLNQTYFNFHIQEPSYSPDPAKPNSDGGGKISFEVITEDIPNLAYGPYNDESTSNKYNFVEKTTVINQDLNDVTSLFDISVRNSSNSLFNFFLELEYEENVITPGLYSVTTSYEMDGYKVTKSALFVIGDYEKNITVNDVEILTSAKDNKMHNNIPGSFRISYSSIFDISEADISVNVLDNKFKSVLKTTVGDTEVVNFEVDKYDSYIDVKYLANTPNIKAGDYVIQIVYTDPNSGETHATNIPVHIYGIYKEIEIADIRPSASVIYADLNDQYYTFNANVASLSEDEINNLKTRIYDSYGNIVFSNIIKDNVENKFSVENNINADGTVKINILAFKARVGTYSVQLLLQDEEGMYLESNKLEFDIMNTNYRVVLNQSSTLTPVNVYKNEADKYYDKDGANGIYKFTSNYPESDNPVYSIKVLKDGKEVKEIEINVEKVDEFGVEFMNTEFTTGELSTGNAEVALCLNGLPYQSLTVKVDRYIPVKDAQLIINKKVITKDFEMFMGQKQTATYKVLTEGVTNPDFEIISSDTSIAYVKDGYINIVGIGKTNITLTNGVYSLTYKLTTSIRVTSEKFEIDYNKKTIFVKSMNKLELTADEFMANLENVADTYSIKNAKGEEVTGDDLVGTNYTFTSGTDTYKVILIGDLNSNGKLDLGDVAAIFQHVRGTNKIKDENLLTAANVNYADTSINLGDVAKVFQFVRGVTNTI